MEERNLGGEERNLQRAEQSMSGSSAGTASRDRLAGRRGRVSFLLTSGALFSAPHTPETGLPLPKYFPHWPVTKPEMSTLLTSSV